MNMRAVAEIERKKIVVCKMRLAINISSIKPKSNKNLFQLNDMKCSCAQNTARHLVFYFEIELSIIGWSLKLMERARSRTVPQNGIVLSCV